MAIKYAVVNEETGVVVASFPEKFLPQVLAVLRNLPQKSSKPKTSSDQGPLNAEEAKIWT